MSVTTDAATGLRAAELAEAVGLSPDTIRTLPGTDRPDPVPGTWRPSTTDLKHLRRARDLIDREYARPLDVPAMARAALMSPARFSRQFRAVFEESPSAYRARNHSALAVVPACWAKLVTRPSRNKEAQVKAAR